jgi:uncharacterized protein YjeT (DUF2065 family)
MERAIQIFAVINLVVIGLSHVAQPRAWAEFFVALREKGDRGVFVVGFMSLAFGSLIVAFHNVWSGLPIVLTILGWAQVLKGLVYFTFPSYGLRKLGIVDVERARMFVWPGLGLLVIAALLGYDLAASG